MIRERLQNDSDGELSIDISPLIDCVFILLVFFIVTTAFIEESGVAVDRLTASAQPVPEEDKPEVMIELFASGEVTFNGLPTELGAIEQMVKSQVGARDDIPAIVKVGSRVPIGTTMRAVDAAALGGSAHVLLGNL